MDFLKRQMFMILCGVGAVAGVALMVTGIRAMPAVKTQLAEVEQLYESLGALQQKPVNERVLEANRRRIEQILADRTAVVSKVKELYRYQPLVADALPNGNPEARLKFKRAYIEEMEKLFQSLRAGRPANETEIAAMKDKIDNEAVRRTTLAAGAPATDAGDDVTPAGVLTAAGAAKDPAARAYLAAAQRVYCYAVDFRDAKPPESESSLMIDSTMRDPSASQRPDSTSVWKAQLGYWIQKDVVDAIVALQDEAAAAARERNQDRWVGIMPVKELISIRLSRNFVMPSEDVYVLPQPGGNSPASPPAVPKSVFTHSATSEFSEVMQFSVKAVMDQRDVLRFVEKICGNGLHTVLRIAYKAVEPNRTLKGKIYGSEPTVNVVMDFETLLPGDVFRPWMPTKVCEEFGIPCPGMEPGKKKDEGG